MQDKIRQLLDAVDNELKKAEIAYKNAKESAQEIAATALTSHSQAGDRFHSQGTADMAKQKYETILVLKEEIEQKIENICYQYQNEDIFLVDNPILISGFKLVSTKSPLGKKILND